MSPRVCFRCSAPDARDFCTGLPPMCEGCARACGLLREQRHARHVSHLATVRAHGFGETRLARALDAAAKATAPVPSPFLAAAVTR